MALAVEPRLFLILQKISKKLLDKLSTRTLARVVIGSDKFKKIQSTMKLTPIIASKYSEIV